MSITIALILSIWNGAKLVDNGSARYILYLLPALIFFIFMVTLRGRVHIDRQGFYALLIYAAMAVLTLIYNRSLGWFSIRDLLIFSSYLAVFILFFRAPKFSADAILAFCLIGTISVALLKGMSSDFNIFNPQGKQLLESVVAFPAGLVFLYYLSERKFGRALFALVLFVLAFKRIAFLGAGAVIGLELCLLFFSRKRIGRGLATMIAIVISITACYSIQIFEIMAGLLNEIGNNANSLSLGRNEIAIHLWDEIDTGSLGNILFGFGPGAADQSLFMSGNITVDSPHNDWLRTRYDYGIIGFIGIHVILYLIHPNTPLGNKFYIFTAILMVTDNPLIYIHYFVSLFLISRISATPENGSAKWA